MGMARNITVTPRTKGVESNGNTAIVDVRFTSTNFYTLFAHLFKTFYSAILAPEEEEECVTYFSLCG